MPRPGVGASGAQGVSYPPASLADLPTGTVLMLDGVPAVHRLSSGWRYEGGRYLGENEVMCLDAYPYVAVLPSATVTTTTHGRALPTGRG